MSESNYIHEIINVQDALNKPVSSENAPQSSDTYRDPVPDKGLVISEAGEKVLLGSEAATAAVRGLTKVTTPAPSVARELTSGERRDVLSGSDRQAIPRASVPANRRYGSEDVGGVPTTMPGPRQVRVENEEGTTFKLPSIRNAGEPGDEPR